jgi:hypothetical protein
MFAVEEPSNDLPNGMLAALNAGVTVAVSEQRRAAALLSKWATTIAEGSLAQINPREVLWFWPPEIRDPRLGPAPD